MNRSSHRPASSSLARRVLPALVGLAALATGTVAGTQANAEGTFTLTAVHAGNGLGSIVSDPVGIDCGSDCTYDFDDATVVSLTAVADVGSTFTGWSGGGCSGTADCEVTISAAVTVTATFTAPDSLVTFADPVRLVDTRRGLQGALESVDEATPISAGTVRRYQIAGTAGVPAGATVALNVTAVTPALNGHLRVFPCDSSADSLPPTSFINFQRLATVANAGLVVVPASGGICVYSSASSHVVLDMTGWLPVGKTHTALAAPVRLFDTRAGQQGVLEAEDETVPFTVDTVRVFSVGGQAGLPASGFNAIVVNVVAITPTSAGELQVYPCDNIGNPAPTTSVVRFVAGVTAAAGGIVGVKSAEEKFCVKSSGDADVLVDVTGYVKVGGGSGYAVWGGSVPKRLIDTRVDQRGVLEGTADVATPLVAGEVARFQMAGIAGLSTAGKLKAVAITVGVLGAGATGNVQAWACNDTTVPAPSTSVINFKPGRAVSNAVFLPVSANGGVCFVATSGTDITIDATGWFK